MKKKKEEKAAAPARASLAETESHCLSMAKRKRRDEAAGTHTHTHTRRLLPWVQWISFATGSLVCSSKNASALPLLLGGQRARARARANPGAAKGRRPTRLPRRPAGVKLVQTPGTHARARTSPSAGLAWPALCAAVAAARLLLPLPLQIFGRRDRASSPSPNCCTHRSRQAVLASLPPPLEPELRVRPSVPSCCASSHLHKIGAGRGGVTIRPMGSQASGSRVISY